VSASEASGAAAGSTTDTAAAILAISTAATGSVADSATTGSSATISADTGAKKTGADATGPTANSRAAIRATATDLTTSGAIAINPVSTGATPIGAAVTIAITGYRSRYDTRPIPAVVTWDSLAARLAKPRVASCTLATCIGAHCPHKCGTLWSPASITPGKTRLNECVTTLSALVLDSDHVPTDADLAAIVERISPYRHIVHATHSDRAGDRCARIVIPLSRPATRDESQAVWSGAVELLGIPVDGSCKDASRAYYAPSRPRDADYYYLSGDGAAIDVDELLAHAPRRNMAPSLRAVTPASTTLDEDRIRRARAYVAELDSRGSDALFFAVCRAMHGFDLDDAMTRSIIVDCFIRRTGARWTERQVDRKIAEARSKVRDREGWLVEARPTWVEETKYSGREPTPIDLRGDRE